MFKFDLQLFGGLFGGDEQTSTTTRNIPAETTEEAELKNKAEQFILMIDRSIEEDKDNKMDKKQKDEAIKLRDELKKAIESNDFDTLRQKVSELEKTAQAMDQYAQQQKGQQGSSGAGSSTDDNVFDADYTEKK